MCRSCVEEAYWEQQNVEDKLKERAVTNQTNAQKRMKNHDSSVGLMTRPPAGRSTNCNLNPGRRNIVLPLQSAQTAF
jgi:hypothetical protein